MGCSNSNAVDTNNKEESKKKVKSNHIKEFVDTTDVSGLEYPHFQYNYYDKNIKNIKKVYEERINEDNNVKVYIHIIHIIINYAKHKTTNFRIEIEKKTGQIPKKHLTKVVFDYECSLDNVKKLIEEYNSRFNIDSSQWYQLKPSTDIYIKAEKTNNNLFKIFEMFYEKDIRRLTYNKKLTIGHSNHTCEAICNNIGPREVVNKYNELKLIFYDNKAEYFIYLDEYKGSPENKKKKKNKNYSNHNNYSYKNNYYNNDNNSIHGNNYNYGNNYDNNSNHNNNESEEKKSRTSAIFRDSNCHEIGRVDRNGIIRDSNCHEIGRFDDDGIIRDSNCHEVGRIDDDGRIRNDCGQERGRVDNDGIVRDDCGHEIGRIDSDGRVRDDCGHEIGDAGGMSKEQAAYMYFFK